MTDELRRRLKSLSKQLKEMRTYVYIWINVYHETGIELIKQHKRHKYDDERLYSHILVYKNNNFIGHNDRVELYITEEMIDEIFKQVVKKL